ncbi:MAG: M1 family metallopeptidase [Bacteroidales bacterium]
MKKLIASVCWLALVVYPVNAQVVNSNPLSQRVTGYKMDVELDPATHIVSGTMDAYWVNISNDKVPDLRLHMYLNAFRSNRSTFSKESGGRSPGKVKDDFGWVDISTLTDRNGNDLTKNMSYVSPDDGNTDDMTVLNVSLPKAVEPKDTVFIHVKFRSKLPASIRRTGYTGDYYFVAQWFPKFGVYEPAGMRYAVKGGWNCHQFHSTSEFYANHSTYDVNITVPEKYVVGSGGMLLEEHKTGDGKKVMKYRAEDIVDFAWTAWPGYAVATDQWKHVKITFLYPPERKDQVSRQLTAVKNALEYLSENVGPYPWPHLTFVDPPAIGQGAGGMEYTTIFTSESANGLPEYIHLPEMVTIHEFGHAYFMGILASNEFEEPWLDEGVNSFMEERIMDHYYGPASMINHPWLKAGDQSIGRSSYVAASNNMIVSNAENSWNYVHGTYGMMSYMKPATWLYTLMGIIGEDAMNQVFREYYREWAFKHPSGKDFIAVFNKVIPGIYGEKYGKDLNWFFDQVTWGSNTCDYRVAGFYNTKLTDYEGVVIDGDSVKVKNNLLKNDTVYSSVVQLERPGEIMLPVDVLIGFDNGDKVIESWDGKARFKDFTYTGKRKVTWVKLDPDYKIKMDINYINNSMTSTPDNKPVRKATNRLTGLMQLFLGIISL